MHRFIMFICLLSTIVLGQESEIQTNSSNVVENDTQVVKEKQVKWALSIIAGSVSKHLSHKYEPAGGYTEQHSSLGVEIGQIGPGWIASIQTTWFNDSHDEDSFMGIGAYGYKANLPHQFFIYGGLGAGYIETSYYSGAIIMPFAELGWWRISAQGSYLPELSNADSGIAVQFKFRIYEW